MKQSKRAKGTAFQNYVEKWILKEFPGAAVHNFKSVARKIEKEAKIDREKLEKFVGANVQNIVEEGFILDQEKNLDLITEILKRKDEFLIQEFFWTSTDQDLWNCIDLEVKLPHCGKPIYIQATSHTGVDKRLKEMAHVPWSFDHQIVQLWQKKEPGRVVIQTLYGKPGDLKFRKVGEIQRGKYIPTILGKTLCEGAEAGPSVL